MSFIYNFFYGDTTTENINKNQPTTQQMHQKYLLLKQIKKSNLKLKTIIDTSDIIKETNQQITTVSNISKPNIKFKRYSTKHVLH